MDELHSPYYVSFDDYPSLYGDYLPYDWGKQNGINLYSWKNQVMHL